MKKIIFIKISKMEKSYFLKNLLYKVAAVENLIKMRIKCICWQKKKKNHRRMRIENPNL